LAFKHLSKSGSKTQKRKSTNHTHTSLHLLLVLFPSSATHLLHDPYKESHAKGKKGGTAKPLFAATKLVSHGCDATDNLLQEAGERVGGVGWGGVGSGQGGVKKKTLLLRTREGEQLGYEKRSCQTRQGSETDEEDTGQGGREDEKRRDTATTMIADAPVQARCARERETETETERRRLEKAGVSLTLAQCRRKRVFSGHDILARN